MIVAGAGALLLAMSAGPTGAPAGSAAPMQLAQLVVREQVIIRTVRVRPDKPNAAPPVHWKETKPFKCLKVKNIRGAALLGQNSVDFVLRNRVRVRAKLNSACPALDYYHGFYLAPGPDGLICADRDFIRSRMGRECGIERFRLLRPVEKP